jgi:hypothetical protein
MTEIYKGERKIKSKVSAGFASIQQKSNLVKLKVLESALINTSNETYHIGNDCYVLVKEEALYTQNHLTQQFEIDGQERKFMLIDYSYIVGVIEPDGD